LKHDTAWSLEYGGRISTDLHNNGLSNDGTSEYLDYIEKTFPDNVTVYRKQKGQFWDGKLEMVNAPLQNINEQCLLWQIDADELWTAEQLCTARTLFIQQPDKTAAYYYCNFFVGPNLIITSRDTYGNHPAYEWLRTWRFVPGNRWTAHEPPRLCRFDIAGIPTDIATINPLLHAETESNGLIFQHFAYSIASQLRFKEDYYGYRDAVKHWERLQHVNQFPVFLREFFPWVTDNSTVDTASAYGITPLLQLGGRKSKQMNALKSSVKKILWIRTDSIGDNVLAMSMLPHLHLLYPDTEITVLCQEHIAELYEECPYVGNILKFNRSEALINNDYRSDVVRKLQAVNADLCLNTVFSREPLTDYFALSCDALESFAFDGDLANIPASDHEANNRRYTTIVTTQGENRPELERYHDFLKTLGANTTQLTPQCWTSSKDSMATDEFFRKNGLRPDKTIAFFPKAQYGIKLYDHYGKALRDICQKEEYTIIGLGGMADFDCTQQHLDHIGVPFFNLCGRITLRESAELVRRCRLAVGADTGMAHIACAVGTLNVIIAGGGHFGRFLPYSHLTTAVSLPLDCFGCNWSCRFGIPYCIKAISPEILTEAVRQTLGGIFLKPRLILQGKSFWEAEGNKPEWSIWGKNINNVDIRIINRTHEDNQQPQPAGTVCK
jgi:ADP-heptose:LPS heptosyltransferase